MTQGPLCREPPGMVGSGGGKWEVFPLVLRLVPGSLRTPRQMLDDLSLGWLAGSKENEERRSSGIACLLCPATS